MIEIVPNWHPIWVHFTIALLVTSSVLFVLFGWKSRQSGAGSQALIVARWTLWLGVGSAAGALLTGYWASVSVVHDDLAHANMMVHRNWAFAAATVFALAALVEFKRRSVQQTSVLSILLVLAGTVLITLTGLEGAENVYVHGLGVQRLPELTSHEHAAGGHDEENMQEMEMVDSHENEEVMADGKAESDKTTLATESSHAHPDSSAHAKPVHVENDDHPASQVATQLSAAIAAGDVDTLRELMAPDVLIFESGNVESSLAEYEGHHMPADMAFMKAMNQEVLFRQIFASDDSATVVTRSRIHGEYKEKGVDLSSTETLVLNKVNGQWKVVHIHWSSS